MNTLSFPERKPEREIISDLIKSSKEIDWVVDRIRSNVDGKLDQPPSREDFWKQMVLALLSSQQRSTKGSALDIFEQKTPFPLALPSYMAIADDEARDLLKSFRFGKRVTQYLRTNYDVLFGPQEHWIAIEPRLQDLFVQRNIAPHVSHRGPERKVSHLLSDHLHGIGPKQARNVLQELGLTRYEIPLDSRVIGWLEENLGWYVSRDDLSNSDDYEFWLDRLQSACVAACVLPTLFDAAAFDKGRSANSANRSSVRIGQVNKNGQVTILWGQESDRPINGRVYQLGCSQCGHVYAVRGSDISMISCPKCQDSKSGFE